MLASDAELFGFVPLGEAGITFGGDSDVPNRAYIGAGVERHEYADDMNKAPLSFGASVEFGGYQDPFTPNEQGQDDAEASAGEEALFGVPTNKLGLRR